MRDNYNVNSQIKAKKFNLILLDGVMKENITLSEAMEIAEEEEMDIVEVSNKSSNGLPTCKVLDYGKFKYQQNKKNKKNKNIQQTKEIKYSFNIDTHDLDVKHKKIFEFLSKHYSVRYVLELKGREKDMTPEALNKVKSNLENFKDVAIWKEPIVSKGGRILIYTTLKPI